MKSLRDDGEPSIRFMLLVRNNIDGRDKRRSVEVIALPSSLNDIREDTSALTVNFSRPSPDTSAPAKARGNSLPQVITFEVFPKAPQPDSMLKLSSRLVLPDPLRPRTKLIPGSHSTLRSGRKFLKFLTTEYMNFKIC